MQFALLFTLAGCLLSVTGSLGHDGVDRAIERSLSKRHALDKDEGLRLSDLDHDRQKRWVAVVVRGIAAVKGSRALKKLLKGTKEGKNKPSKTVKEHHKDGDMQDAVDLHKSLGGNPKPIQGDKTKGFTSQVGDRTFTVRDNSNSGKATIESFKTGTKKGKDRVTDKVRFSGEKSNTGGSNSGSSGSSNSGSSNSGSSNSGGGGGGWWRKRRRRAAGVH